MTDTDDPITIESTYRPYPLSAKKALRDAVESIEFDDNNPRLAYSSEVPPADLVDEYELDVHRDDDPVEVWETDHGDRVEIYDDRVERNGTEASIGPEEAKEQARKQRSFTRIDDGED